MPADQAAGLTAWIDATDPASGRRLWGMTVVERQIRQLCLRGVARFRICVSAASLPAVRAFRADLFRLYSFGHDFVADGQVETEAPEGADERACLLVLVGAAVYDDRVLDRLLAGDASAAVCGPAGLVAARLQPRQFAALVRDGRLCVDAATVRRAGVACLPVDALDPYVRALRLRLPPVMARVPAAGSLDQLDHLLYRRSFKGVIDAVALYGYYRLVRWLTRRLSDTALPPNLFTVLSILGIWAAVPLFAAGRFGLGALAAWVGVILDSVDGKLARLRLHFSDTMGAIEHLTAMPGLGCWYLATGYRLTGGQLASGQPLAWVTWALLGFFLLDKGVTGTFAALARRELFDYAAVDAAFHLVAARRNVALVLLTLGAAANRVALALEAVALWTGATLVFHLARATWILGSRRTRPRQSP